MTAKEYLMQLELFETRIDNKRSELAAMRLISHEVQGVDYSSPKVQTSPVSDAIGRNIVWCMQQEREIEDDIERFIALKHDIVQQINSLDNKVFVKILFLRYVEYRKLAEVAGIMGYSYQHVRRLHGYALQSFMERNGTCIHRRMD